MVFSLLSTTGTEELPYFSRPLDRQAHYCFLHSGQYHISKKGSTEWCSNPPTGIALLNFQQLIPDLCLQWGQWKPPMASYISSHNDFWVFDSLQTSFGMNLHLAVLVLILLFKEKLVAFQVFTWLLQKQGTCIYLRNRYWKGIFLTLEEKWSLPEGKRDFPHIVLYG